MKIDLITADTGPLIHLASIGQLNLLKGFGKVHIPDLVVMEAIVQGKPFAEEIKDWLTAGVADQSISIEETSTGELLRLARTVEPDKRMKDGGERAILDWLIDTVDAQGYSAMVIYENGKVPKLIQNHDSELSAAVITTRSFLSLCEKDGLIQSADKLWEKLLGIVPSINQLKNVAYFGRLADEEFKP